jgi:hypothetical protein
MAAYESCERISLLASPRFEMSITTTDTTFFDPLEELLRQLTERVDAVVDPIARESYQLDRHEEFTTSRLAQAVTSELRDAPITVPGLALEVHAEEFRPTHERKIGADLYISVVRRDLDFTKSKGILVQAKRRISLLRDDESRRLGNQSKRMYRRSDDSYVWIYEQDGVTCTKAPRSSMPTLTRITNPMSVGELIADGLRCNLGDEDIGRDASAPTLEGISDVMQRLTVPRALDFVVRQD